MFFNARNQIMQSATVVHVNQPLADVRPVLKEFTSSFLVLIYLINRGR